MIGLHGKLDVRGLSAFLSAVSAFIDRKWADMGSRVQSSCWCWPCIYSSAAIVDEAIAQCGKWLDRWLDREYGVVNNANDWIKCTTLSAVKRKDGTLYLHVLYLYRELTYDFVSKLWFCPLPVLNFFFILIYAFPVLSFSFLSKSSPYSVLTVLVFNTLFSPCRPAE